MAVVVTKTDVCNLAVKNRVGRVDLHSTYSSKAAAASRAEGESRRVRALLLKAGLGNLVQIFETRFDHCAFFAAAALSPADSVSGDAFRPRGVLPPLVWLAHHVNALGDVDAFDFFFINSHVYLMRALRGLEGDDARKATLLTLAGFIALVLVLVLLLPPLLLLLAGGFQLVVLFILYLYLAYVLLYRSSVPLTRKECLHVRSRNAPVRLGCARSRSLPPAGGVGACRRRSDAATSPAWACGDHCRGAF